MALTLKKLKKMTGDKSIRDLKQWYKKETGKDLKKVPKHPRHPKLSLK